MVGMRTEVYPFAVGDQVMMRAARIASENGDKVQILFEDACAAQRGQQAER